MLTDEERKYFADANQDIGSICAAQGSRAELVQLTCAALTGLFSTPLIETPTGFAQQAVRIAVSTQQQINNHFEAHQHTPE